jgi:CubicO group peptidase (beta-lactamase class C family)
MAVAGGFEPVREAFAQVGPGCAVAAWHDGRWVADLSTLPPGGIVQPYSVTKAFAAVPALVLVDRGLLDLDAPVQRYWPEFTAPATVRQVLSHQAGVVAIDEPAPTAAYYDWDRMCGLLAAQEPAWTPGQGLGEAALCYGHLVGELVRRIDGRTPGVFLAEEVCDPLEIDFAIGLDASRQARAVDLTGFADLDLSSRSELYHRALANPPGAFDPAVVNGPAWRAAEVPAVNGHGTARAIAAFYVALVRGEILSADLLAEATTAQATGRDLVMGSAAAWGLGFGVDPDGYGMGGTGGSVGWASTAGGYAFAFVTSVLGTHDRADAVENALRGCLGLPDLN